MNLNGIFTTALYSLLKLGNENCCEVIKPATYTQPIEQQLLFSEDSQADNDAVEENRVTPKEEPKKSGSTGKENPKKPSPLSRFFNNVKNTVTQGTFEFIGQITEDESDDNNDND